MKDYSYVIGKVTSQPWMITPEALKLMLDILDAHVSGTITHDEIRMRLQDIDRRGSGSHASRAKNIGVLGITGPIFPKANLMTELSGGTTLSQFQSDFRSMMDDDSIGAILLDVDSPGGLSEGIEEMASEIREARDRKPVYAIANAAANSAAYYLASQAGQVFATPSAQVGSVGTYLVHTDESRRDEMQGIKETVIHAGRFKAVSQQPLTPEGASYLQDFVDSVNDDFISAVAAGRRTTEDDVRQNYGEGGIVTAKTAITKGMIDGIGTYEQVLNHIGASLSGGTPSVTTASAVSYSKSALVTFASYDADKEHSEPGTGQGGEPTPREAPETGDPAIEGGWRRDTPPPPYDVETEASAVNRTWLEERATALGIEFDAETSDEDLATAVSARVEEIVVPLQSATQTAQDEREFRERYPEQAAQLMRLEQRDRETSAALFADSYRSFANDATRGYSPVVRELIADAHLKINSRQFSNDDLKALLDATSSKESVVQLGEAGSSRATEPSALVAQGNVQEIRKQFADLVRTAMNEDNLTREAAIEHVSKQNPELAQAYLTARA
jgi:signal peptide peptidase SppA